jgi:hypothetical protein
MQEIIPEWRGGSVTMDAEHTHDRVGHRLLREIMKSDLYLQLEAVRAVISVYSGKPPAQAGSSQPISAASGLGSKMNIFIAA